MFVPALMVITIWVTLSIDGNNAGADPLSAFFITSSLKHQKSEKHYEHQKKHRNHDSP